VRVATPNEKCVEIQGPTGRTYDFGKGIQNVHPRDARAIVAEGGFIPSALGTTRTGLGYRCTACGFGTWFSKCSRCGGHAAREVLH